MNAMFDTADRSAARMALPCRAGRARHRAECHPRGRADAAAPDGGGHEGCRAPSSTRTTTGRRSSDPWAFFEQILGWEARFVAGAPGGPRAAGRTCGVKVARARGHAVARTGRCASSGDGRRLPDSGEAAPERRAPTSAVRCAGWEATPHQQFERLLRETRRCRSACWSTARTSGSSTRRAARPPAGSPSRCAASARSRDARCSAG